MTVKHTLSARAAEPGSGRGSSARLRASSDALCARSVIEWPRWPLASLASAALTVFAAFVAPSVAIAQYGTPPDMRAMKPTIRDAEPGMLPKGGTETVDEVYRRQPVFYRTSEAPG